MFDLHAPQPDYCADLDEFELSAADVARIWTEGGYETRRTIDTMLAAQKAQMEEWAREMFR